MNNLWKIGKATRQSSHKGVQQVDSNPTAYKDGRNRTKQGGRLFNIDHLLNDEEKAALATLEEIDIDHLLTDEERATLAALERFDVDHLLSDEEKAALAALECA